MEKGICYIVGAGECSRLLLHPKKEDCVIAVDGGYEYVKEERVNLVVGDFDSLGYVPEHPGRICLPCEKNDTDMLAAVKEGRKAGYKNFHIYGGCGGRFAHTAANLQVLAYLTEQGAKGILFGEQESITMLQNGSMTFDRSYKGYISLFSYGEKAEGVTLTGLKYPLKDAVLYDDFPIGVSNEFTGEAACISVKKGRLLVIYQNQ